MFPDDKRFKSIQDIMRKDAGVDGDAQRIGQLVWMFFLKIFDDKERSTSCSKRTTTTARPLPEPLRWRNWAADPEGITGDELLDFVNNGSSPAQEPAAGACRQARLRHPQRLRGCLQLHEVRHLMRQVINKINGIDFNKARGPPPVRRHLREDPARPAESAGNAGEFYTPRAGHPVHRRAGRPPPRRENPRPRLRHRRLPHLRHRTLRKQVKTEDEQLHAGLFRRHREEAPAARAVHDQLLLHGIDVPTNVRHDNTLARPLRDYGPRSAWTSSSPTRPSAAWRKTASRATSPPSSAPAKPPTSSSCC
jgi:type I restriction enzyme M protein